MNPLARELSGYWKSFYHSLICRTYISPSFRFREAARHIDSGMTVLDICCGSCELRHYLPKNCQYSGLDCSNGFLDYAVKKKIDFLKRNVCPDMQLPDVDCIVMIISLYQFGDTARNLLETFKRSAKKVVIIEDVLSSFIDDNQAVRRKLLARIYDYLVVGNDQEGHVIFSAITAEKIFQDAGFTETYKPNCAYVVGVFERNRGEQGAVQKDCEG